MDKEEQERFEAVKVMIYAFTSKYPQLVSEVIDTATQGVRSFADGERSSSSRLSGMLYQELNNQHGGATQLFSRPQMIDAMTPSLGGTPAFEELKTKLNTEADHDNA